MFGAKVSVRREGNKIVYTFDFGDERVAKAVLNTIKANPQFLQQFDQYRAIIKSISIKHDKTKILQIVEFEDEKSAECFYFLQKKIASNFNFTTT